MLFLTLIDKSGNNLKQVFYTLWSNSKWQIQELIRAHTNLNQGNMSLIMPMREKLSSGRKSLIPLIPIRTGCLLPGIYFKPCPSIMAITPREITSITLFLSLIKTKVVILILGSSWKWFFRSLMKKIPKKTCREYLMM